MAVFFDLQHSTAYVFDVAALNDAVTGWGSYRYVWKFTGTFTLFYLCVCFLSSGVQSLCVYWCVSLMNWWHY